MIFNTVEFLIFFLVVLIIYWILPAKIRYIWLLVSSYYFYMQWNPYYILLLISATTITYIGGLIVEKLPNNKSKQRVLTLSICLVICLGILGIFKYADFTISLINSALHILGRNTISWTSKFILPVGISFYTLQAIGYLIDVYRGDIYAEKNYLKFALFVSFFPQLVAGPIERSKNLLKQLGTAKKFSYNNLQKGIILMLYGLFLKMVIADRAAIFVDAVYSDYVTYNGIYILIAAILFSIQIYCDFYGYSTIARGTALTMGFTLVENFNSPYLSGSVKEFWQRWHMSLSTWFRDYLYIPLGGNRKGKIRKNINLLIVFLISGLWHGASISFVFWGLLNGVYQVISNIISPLRNIIVKFTNWEEYVPEKIIKKIVTFCFIGFAWIFFRAGAFREALKIIVNLFDFQPFVLFDGSLYNLGITQFHFSILITAIIVLFFIDYLKYKGLNVVNVFVKQNFWFRCLVEVILIFSILLFGCYGEMYDANSFIYFQF